jgi:hypothetical protein
MTDYDAPLYQHPQEEWDAKTCEKLSKRVAKDGLGTKYPFKGYIYQGEIGHHIFGNTVRYNGGCIRDGQWWQGEEWPLPKLADGYKFVYVTTWGWRIVRADVPSLEPSA